MTRATGHLNTDATWEPDCSQPTRPEHMPGENGPGGGDCWDEDDEPVGTDEGDMELILRDALEFAAGFVDDLGVKEVHLLAETGFLTRDKGLHIVMNDGSEWTVGIACYKRPR